MDERHLEAGETAYAAGEWQHAALEFMAAAHGGPPEGAGHALHHAGNALVKLGRYADAATVYRKAACDLEYEKRGAVFANLGAALAAAGAHTEAIAAYDDALADPTYPTPYKALFGKAGALYATEQYEEATKVFRKAAWAEGNPDPGRALNNLGLSFMALGKPEDAQEAFKAALGIEGYSAKGKASANLALAYSAMGFFDEAAHEFENARDVHGYALTGAMLESYEAALAKMRSEGTGPIGLPRGDADPGSVTGWLTGDLGSPAVLASEATGPISLVPDDDEDEATKRFFAMTEDEMLVVDRDARKAEKTAKRNPKALAIRIALIVVAVLVVAGGLAGAFYLGYGYPTQEQTVTSLLDAYKGGTTYTAYWVAVPTTDVKQAMRVLPAKFQSFKIDGVDRAALKSTVLVVVTLEGGSTLSYKVQLAREGVGWKVIGVQNRWGSTPS